MCDVNTCESRGFFLKMDRGKSADECLNDDASVTANKVSNKEIQKLKKKAMVAMLLLVFLVMMVGTVCGFIDAETLERLTPALTNLAAALKTSDSMTNASLTP